MPRWLLWVMPLLELNIYSSALIQTSVFLKKRWYDNLLYIFINSNNILLIPNIEIRLLSNATHYELSIITIHYNKIVNKSILYIICWCIFFAFMIILQKLYNKTNVFWTPLKKDQQCVVETLPTIFFYIILLFPTAVQIH